MPKINRFIDRFCMFWACPQRGQIHGKFFEKQFLECLSLRCLKILHNVLHRISNTLFCWGIVYPLSNEFFPDGGAPFSRSVNRSWNTWSLPEHNARFRYKNLRFLETTVSRNPSQIVYQRFQKAIKIYPNDKHMSTIHCWERTYLNDVGDILPPRINAVSAQNPWTIHFARAFEPRWCPSASHDAPRGPHNPL